MKIDFWFLHKNNNCAFNAAASFRLFSTHLKLKIMKQNIKKFLLLCMIFSSFMLNIFSEYYKSFLFKIQESQKN